MVALGETVSALNPSFAIPNRRKKQNACNPREQDDTPREPAANEITAAKNTDHATTNKATYMGIIVDASFTENRRRDCRQRGQQACLA